jgi:hypothetical protein
MEDKSMSKKQGYCIVPHILHTDPAYRNLSAVAVLLYCYMCGLLQASLANAEQFTDEYGVYVILTVDRACAIAHCGRDLVRKSLQLLVDAKLISRRLMGHNRPARIYVNLIPDFPYRLPSPGYQNNDNINLLDARNSDHRMSETPLSGSRVNRAPDVGNSVANKKNNNGNEYTDNNIFDSLAAFAKLYNAYPAHRRGDYNEAYHAFSLVIHTVSEFSCAMDNLTKWTLSSEWEAHAGQYVPKLHTWLARGIWQHPPHSRTRHLDADEERAIAQLLSDDNYAGI